MRAQTATEYLVITAVVIIISLIVVGVLAGSPGVGSSTDIRVNMAELRSEKIGTETFTVNDNETVLILRNNLNKNIQITQILIAGIICDDPSIPITLTLGKKTTVNCDNINTTSDDFNLAYQMSYRETSGAGGSYTLELPNLIGSAGDNVTGGAVELGGEESFTCDYLNSTGVGDGLFYNGTGTASAPYGICNCTMLQDLNQTAVLGANATLLQNINCTDTSTWNGGSGFSPIGTCTGASCTGGGDDDPYVGRFFGQGYNITGLYQDWSSLNGVGLFGNGYQSSSIMIRLYDVGIENDVTGNNYVGGLVGYGRKANISNSFASGTVSGGNYVGGLAGTIFEGYVTNSYVTANVDGNNRVGGLVGYANSGELYASYVTGTVYGTGNYIGGISSEGYSTLISNSYVTGDVTGTNYVGGILGFDSGSSTIDNSYVTSNTSGTNHVGGLLGYGTYLTTIQDSYTTGDVTGTNNIGGLSGSAYFATIQNSYSTSYISANNYVGGLFGAGGDFSITNGTTTSTINASDFVGGLVGQVSGTSTIDDSAFTGVIDANNRVGGLVGDHPGAYLTITNSFTRSYVTGNNSVGGVSGYVGGGSNELTSVYSESNVTCYNEYCGGLVGDNDGGYTTLTTANWTNYTGDTVTGCIGQNGTTEGVDFSPAEDCTTVTP